MTAKRLSDRSFIFPGANVDRMDELNFWTGFSLFRDPWVIAPSSTKDRDGLGPIFNTRSCISCHLAGARGDLPEEGESLPSAMVLRLGSTVPGDNKVDPHYGGQIQPRSIAQAFAGKDQPLRGEASMVLTYNYIDGAFPDGETYQLRKPNIELSKLNYGTLAQGVGLSPRFAPVVYGSGLLDAIAEADLLVQEDIEDSDGDGISAKYNRVLNVRSGAIEIGRFGLKAKQPNLAQQVAAAFRDDIGITNNLFPEESCSSIQQECQLASAAGGHAGVEIPDKLLDLVITFNQYIAVPPARRLDNPQVANGRQLFYQSDCAACHTPNYTTEQDYPVAELAGQTIWPYSNLALHDMGEGLADGVNEFDANGREWRTPPLWGLGLQAQYRKQETYLHDGRARTLQEAILWHGGEAEASKNNFKRLDKADRDALIAFIKAI